MKTISCQKRKAYLAIGGMGLFGGAGYLGLSAQLPFGKLDQPGAGVFPVIVAFLLMIASLATMWEGWQLGLEEQVDLPAGPDRRRLAYLIGLVCGYFLTLPWLGQIISSTLFCLLLMRILSNLHWPRLVANSLAISMTLYVGFVLILKVPMPRGLFGF